MEFLEVVGTRRSVRWFKTYKPVEREKIQEILEVMRWTTCPGNLQPWRAVVVWRDELDDDVREELLQADNWQGGHVQAPVWIYIFADPEAARPDAFATSTQQLIEVGAVPVGLRLEQDPHRRRDRARGGDPGRHGRDPRTAARPARTRPRPAIAYSETVGACAVSPARGGEPGPRHLPAHDRPPEQAGAGARRLLGVPEHWIPVWVQLVGYSAEGVEAGGQRPRNDFETLFFEGNANTPFRRDPKVVAEDGGREVAAGAGAHARPPRRADVPRPHVRLPRGPGRLS